MSQSRLLPLAGLALVLSACTAGQTAPSTAKSVNPITTNTLELAVGTANVAGTTGMNVVALLRQPNGESGALVNTPHLTGPFTLPGVAGTPGGPDGLSTEATGPSADEIAHGYIGGTPQTAASNVTGTPTTFGQSGGVFGNGFAPSNYNSTGNAYSYTPYDEPMYATSGTFTPWGGPPAFDPDGDKAGTLDGKFPLLGGGTVVRGIPLGVNVFAGVTPNAGAYSLNVAVPTSTTSTGTLTASASLASAALLPAAATPVVTLNGDGTATVAYTLPAGVTGAYVQLEDLGVPTTNADGSVTYGGWCNGASTGFGSGGTVPYTFWVTASGTVMVGNDLGPGNATAGHQAICTAATNSASAGAATPGDSVEAVLVGFDYNQYSLQYNGATGSTYPQAPALPPAADATISPVLIYNADGTVTPVSKLHRSAAVRRLR